MTNPIIQQAQHQGLIVIQGNEVGPVEAIAWKEKKPLHRECSPSVPFPVDQLGDILGGAVKDIIEATQAPPAMVAQSVLAAACLAVQGHRDISIDGRNFPLSEFFVTIGESGERKTAVDAIALHAHREHEEQLRDRYQSLKQIYLDEKAVYDKEREQILTNKNKNQEERKAALTALGAPPEPPLEPTILIEEPTYEGMLKLLDCGQPSEGLFAHEGGMFIGGHGMSEDNQLRMITGLSLLWDGKPIKRVRSGEAFRHIDGKRLTLHLMCQAAVADLLLGNDLAKEQGFLSRCLVARPESTVGTREYREIDPYDTGAMRVYYNTIKTILQKAVVLQEKTANVLKPVKLVLSQTAKTTWVKFHNKIESLQAPDQALSGIKGFASKVAEHALRLAGILTVIDNSQNNQIEREPLDRAIQLMQFYVMEAIRLNELGTQPGEIKQASALLLWLRAQGRQFISLVEIYNRGPNQIRSSQIARKRMATLEEHGWVRRSAVKLEFNGSIREECYEVRLD